MNENLRKLIRKHEGCSLIPYKCPAGFKTIGWGWNFDSNPLPEDVSEYMHDNGKITAEMAERLLTISLERSVADARKLYKNFDEASENRQVALASMLFQMGATTMSGFVDTNPMIRRGEWDAAADNLLKSKWAMKDTPKRAKEVIKLLRDG
jgi:lysozyme